MQDFPPQTNRQYRGLPLAFLGRRVIILLSPNKNLSQKLTILFGGSILHVCGVVYVSAHFK